MGFISNEFVGKTIPEILFFKNLWENRFSAQGLCLLGFSKK